MQLPCLVDALTELNFTPQGVAETWWVELAPWLGYMEGRRLAEFTHQYLADQDAKHS